MSYQQRSFNQILQQEAKKIACVLESKARIANWLAHSHPAQSHQFFAIKHRLISRLFKVAGYEPAIQSCERTRQGLILSIKLSASWGRLHVPLNRLLPSARKYVLEPRTRTKRLRSARTLFE